MRLLRYATVLVVAAAVLALHTDSADAAQKKKKNKGGNGIKGAITSVEKVNDDVKLTIKSVNKKTGESKETKVTVKKDTKIEKRTGTKKDKQTTTAALSDLTVGKNVLITTKSGQTDQAERVLLAGKGKKKKNNN